MNCQTVLMSENKKFIMSSAEFDQRVLHCNA